MAPLIAEPLRYHWLPVVALEVSVTLPPAQNVTGPAGVIVGVAGFAFTTTVVEPAADGQPLTVTVTEYEPLFATVAFAMVGFCTFEVNPFGPVHVYVAPATLAVLSEIVVPSQYGPPFDAVGVVGVGVTVTVVEEDMLLEQLPLVTWTV